MGNVSKLPCPSQFNVLRPIEPRATSELNPINSSGFLRDLRLVRTFDRSPTMAETTLPRPSSAISRPVSESLLNEKWDRCLSNLLVKSTLGLGFGVVFSVLLFKRRAWPAFVGVGFGAGRAYEECNFSLKQAARDLKKQAA